MTIYLIRHTKVAVKPGICYGQSDVGLADSFNKEAKIIQDKISNFVEVGPGRVLQGLTKRIDRNIKSSGIETNIDVNSYTNE